MEAKTQRHKEQEGAISALNATIKAESREGNFKYHTSQDCFWLRQRHPHHDQSELPSDFSLTDFRPKPV